MLRSICEDCRRKNIPLFDCSPNTVTIRNSDIGCFIIKCTEFEEKPKVCTITGGEDTGYNYKVCADGESICCITNNIAYVANLYKKLGYEIKTEVSGG